MVFENKLFSKILFANSNIFGSLSVQKSGKKMSCPLKIYLILLFFCIPLNVKAGVVDGNVIMDQSMTENLCALTFDDGPSRNTPQLLDLLKEYNIPATFFLLGSQVVHNPQLVTRMVEEGHEIGNHSWSHPNLKYLSTENILEEIIDTDTLLKSLGVTALYMRPPYGSYDERTVQILNDLGASLVLWSLDSRDWKHLPEDYSRLISTRGTVYEPGSLRGIFLFHDTRKTTVEDLPRIITNLRNGGCERFVTVSDYLAGILDPEPGLLMSRNQPKPAQSKPVYVKHEEGSKLLRCSKPWKPTVKNDQNLEFKDAHAQVTALPAGL